MECTLAEDLQRWWNEPNLRPTAVKRQHYVPRVLLKAFADVGGNIRVVDLDRNNGFTTSTENAAVEGHYYDFLVQDTIVSTEDWLA